MITKQKRKKTTVSVESVAAADMEGSNVCGAAESNLSELDVPTEHIDISALIRDNIVHIKQKHKLSGRETEVLELLLEGNSAKQIAERLFVGFDTVRFHCKNIYRKLNVHSQVELIKFCQDYKK